MKEMRGEGPHQGGISGFIERCESFAAAGPHGHALSRPAFPIDAHDVAQLLEGVDSGLIEFKALGRFNTLDRPTSVGHWSMLSFYRAQTIINGEYLPQLACYVDLIRRLRYPAGRVLFEPGDRCERVDLTVLNDGGRVVIMGEAKVDPSQPDDLVQRMRARYSTAPPQTETKPPKGREYEAWKTADAVWKLRPRLLWLVAPGVRAAYEMTYEPLLLRLVDDLPAAITLGLDPPPTRQLLL